LPGAEARDDVRASEPAGVRGADEGEADQGAEAEGTPVGAGGSREDAGQRRNGSRSAGAGIKEHKGGSAVADLRVEGEQQARARTNSQSDRSVAGVAEGARPGEPGREITSVR